MKTSKKVRDLLRGKGSRVWSVTPDDSVLDALRVLAEKEIGAVLVVQNNRLVGILSERDYARQVILKGKASKDTLVREIMTTRVAFVGPDQTLGECMALMTGKRIRHLPVMEGDDLLGVISIGDVVKAVIDEQEFLIEQLENYITSG